ncbi:hypothetical protein NECAME_14848 [Necator americanus]|uniref:Uncharacterized protein n=1 Tax=Necator americanus TaxID=51031 RepID=W2SKZ6_NECAM|nr:hypothetical protein NECAME_14848 [Necator americanus]ETN70329.1 hypothetical protein NECAME_14848 [Necator americanus]
MWFEFSRVLELQHSFYICTSDTAKSPQAAPSPKTKGLKISVFTDNVYKSQDCSKTTIHAAQNWPPPDFPLSNVLAIINQLQLRTKAQKI